MPIGEKKNKEKAIEILKDFILSYVQNEKSENKKELSEWLFDKLREELPEKTEEELRKISLELIEGINKKIELSEELEENKKFGITNSDFVGDKILENIELIDDDAEKTLEYLRDVSEELEIENVSDIYEVAYKKEPVLVSEIIGANSSMEYIDDIKTAIDTANSKSLNTILNKDGMVSANKNLDGFIFEQEHANTFNIEAVVQRKKNLLAEALEPAPGETYGKNSVDLVIRDNGKIVKKYQAKAGKDTQSTEKLFKHGDYRGQRKLVPEEQDILNSTDKIDYSGVESTPQSKEIVKMKQEKVQSGEVETIKKSFKNDIKTIEVVKQISKQSMVSAGMGLGIGMGLDITGKIISGENIEAEEVILSGLKVGGATGLSTAVAGGLKVAVEKEIIGGVAKTVLSSNNVIGAIAVSTVDIISSAYRLGKGDITVGEAVGEISKSLAVNYATIYSFGKVSALLLGVVGIPGGVIGMSVGLVGGAITSVVTSKVAKTLLEGIGKVATTIADTAVKVVKSGAETVKAVGKGIWEGTKAVGRGIVGGVKAVGRGIKSFFGL